MLWRQRKRLRAFLKNSLWVVPVGGMLAALIVAPLTRHLDSVTRFRLLGFDLEGARAAVGVIGASMLSFVVFFFSVLLVTVQIASGTLSPRIIARPFQSKVLKSCLGLFVFTFIYSLAVVGRLGEHVLLELPVFIAVTLSIVSVGAFLFVVEFVGKELRPVTVLSSVAQEGLKVIRSVYPLPWSGTVPPLPTLPKGSAGCRTVCHRGTPGAVLAFNLEGLFALALGNDCIIELIPQVGDYVTAGASLFRIYEGGDAIRSGSLRDAILLGRERTLEQDPAFAFRIVVDIAEKALSPAINDPTTGVIAIDQIQCLLQEVVERDLSSGTVCDDNGRVRVVYRTPNWEDFVSLAASEIRHYGGGSVQIVRRLRRMLTSLIAVAPPPRRPCLLEQLELLRVAVERTFPDPRDRAYALIADSQGLGGALSPADRK